MPKAISRTKLIQRFRQLGFAGPYTGGRHQFMVKGALKLRIPNPHRGDISGPLVREILRQAGVSQTIWERAED